MTLTLELDLPADALHPHPVDASGAETGQVLTATRTAPDRFQITLDQREVPSLWFGMEELHVPRRTTGRRRASGIVRLLNETALRAVAGLAEETS